jgi:hypothetical protein
MITPLARLSVVFCASKSRNRVVVTAFVEKRAVYMYAEFRTLSSATPAVSGTIALGRTVVARRALAHARARIAVVRRFGRAYDVWVAAFPGVVLANAAIDTVATTATGLVALVSGVRSYCGAAAPTRIDS